MKKFTKVALMVFALSVLFSTYSVTEAEAQIINTLLNKMDNHYKALDSIQSDITMAKYDSLIESTDTTFGTIKYLPEKKNRSMYVRIDWTKPVQEHLAIVKGVYTLYRPRLNQAIIGEVNKAKGNAKVNGALAFMSMSKQDLKNNYSVKYLGLETVSGKTEAAHLELLPKINANYKSAELWVDVDGMPILAKINEKNGDSTTILLSSIKKNSGFDYAVFTLNLPANIVKIKG